MIKNKYIFGLLLFGSVALAVTVQDTTTPGRVVDGNLVSDADEEIDQPVFGNVKGSGNVTITWNQVTVDTNGDPVDIVNYEVRHRLVGATVYSVDIVPSAYVGFADTFATGSYEGYVEAVSSNGWTTTAATFTFEVQ